MLGLFSSNSYVSLSECTPQKMFQVDHWLSPKFFGVLPIPASKQCQSNPKGWWIDTLSRNHLALIGRSRSTFVNRYYINSISMDWFHSFHFPFIRIAHSTSSLISIPHLGIPYHAENTPGMASPDRREQLAEVGENTTPWKNTSTLNNTSASF